MTDNEIIKALECCVNLLPCEECHLGRDFNCRDNLLENALSLINRQKAEIERLNKEVDCLSQCVLYSERFTYDLINELVKDIVIQYPEAEYYIYNLVKEMVGDDDA